MLGFRHHDHGPMNIGHLGEPIYLSIQRSIYVAIYIPSHPITSHVIHTGHQGLVAMPQWQSHHPPIGNTISNRYGCEAGDVISKSPIVGTSIPSPVIWLIYGYYKVNIWLMGIYIYIYIWGFPYNKKGTSIPSHIYIYSQ